MGALRLATSFLLGCGLVAKSWAQGVPLPDAQLARVWGQAMVEVSNTSVNGYDFSRITLNADLSLSANFSKIRLGEYPLATGLGNGSGADIDIARLQFGRSDMGDGARTVALSNPYLELVYRNGSDTSQREVIGMRLGFEGIQGSLGLSAQSISGSLAISDTQGHVLDSRLDPAGGKRWDGTACGPSACPFSLAAVGALQAGDANGPSRDFFLSILKAPVQFPTAVAGATAPDLAQAGLWLNWRDRLLAINPGSALPPNLPPTLPPLLEPGG